MNTTDFNNLRGAVPSGLNADYVHVGEYEYKIRYNIIHLDPSLVETFAILDPNLFTCHFARSLLYYRNIVCQQPINEKPS